MADDEKPVSEIDQLTPQAEPNTIVQEEPTVEEQDEQKNEGSSIQLEQEEEKPIIEQPQQKEGEESIVQNEAQLELDATAPEEQVNMETNEAQSSAEPKVVYAQVMIDSDSETDDAEQEILLQNFGLPYSDHNYDVPDKNLRAVYRYDETFPVIGGLDEYGNIPATATTTTPSPTPQSLPHQQQHQSNQPQVHLQQQHPHLQGGHQTQHHQPIPKQISVQNAVKQYQANQYNMGMQQEHPRNEPSIVARAPALRDGAVYRVNAQTDLSPAVGGNYASAPRPVNIVQNRGQTIRARVSAELSQSIQPPMFGQHNQSHVIPVRTNVVAARRQQQAGNPGGYQHITHPSPNQINQVRRPAIPSRPPANPGLVPRTGIRQAFPKGPMEHMQEGLQHPEYHHVGNQLPPVQRRIPDMAPHRMTQEQRMQQQQMVSQTRPAQFPVMEGCAPMLVPARGSRLLVRGRAGSSTTRRREEGMDQPQLAQHGSPQRGLMLETPVHLQHHSQNVGLIQQQQQQQQQHIIHQQPGSEHIQRELPISPRKIPLGDYAHASPSSVNLQAQSLSDQLPAQLTEDPVHHEASPALPLPIRQAPSPIKSPVKQLIHLTKPTPPHRMTQEEKNAHIARHLEKDKPIAPLSAIPPALLAPQTVPQSEPVATPAIEDSVSAVVAAVAAAASLAPPNSSAKAIFPKSTKAEQTKEQDEISKLAHDLRMSAEFFQQPDKNRHGSFSGHQSTSEGSNHSNPPSIHGQFSNQHWESKDMSKSAIMQTIETITKQIEEEKTSGTRPEKKPRNSLPKNLIEPLPMVLTHSTPQMVSPDLQPRQRGRPKGSTGTRHRWTSIQEGGENVRPQTNGRVGQGVRTLAPVLRLPPHAAMNSMTNGDMQDNKDSDSESDGVKQNDDYGEDWTMRCHCGLAHGSGHCVECETCTKWQHTLCMGMSPNDNTDGYQCEKCRPRHLKLSKADARKLQKQELDKEKKALSKKNNNKSSGKKKSMTKETTSRRKSRDVAPAYIDSNEYSRTAVRLLKSLGSTVGAADLLQDAKQNERAKMLFVEENVYGLVTTDEIEGRAVVMELSGYVCRTEECERECGGSPFVYQYDGLMKGPTGEDVGVPTGNELVCIDTRKKGNDAKYTRRSCNPNCVLKHVLDDRGTLGVMIVATKDIPYNTEITLPFDNDFRSRKTPLNCADHPGKDLIFCPSEHERIQEAKLEELAARFRQEEMKGKVEEEEEKPEVVAPKSNGRESESRKRKGRPIRGGNESSPSTSTAPPPQPPPVEKITRKSVAAASQSPKVVVPKESSVVKVKEEMNYDLPSEKTKLTREELKTQQYENIFKKQDELAKKKLSKEKSKEATSKTPVRGLSEEKAEVKKEIAEPPVVEKRTSARVAKTSISSSAGQSTTAEEKEGPPLRELPGRTKKKRVNSDKSTESGSSKKTTELTSPVKRWRAEEAKKVEEVEEKPEIVQKSTPMAFKKQWMKRHNEDVNSGQTSTSSNNSSPTKKTRRTTSEVTKYKVGDVWAKMKENAVLATKQQPSDYSIDIQKDEKPSRQVKQFRDEIKQREEEEEERKKAEQAEIAKQLKLKLEEEEKKKKEEEEREAEKEKDRLREIAAQIEEEKRIEEERKAEEERPPPKKEQKKLSLSEYKMRRPTASNSREDNQPKTSGFIPSTEGSSTQSVSLATISLESQSTSDEAPRFDSNNVHDAQSTSYNADDRPTTPTSQSGRTRSGVAPVLSADDSPAHTMSLKDRFFNVFGGTGPRGSSTSPQQPPPKEEPTRRSRTSRWH